MTILWDGRINSVGLSGSYWNQDEYASDNIVLAADPAGSGEQVAKCTLRATDGLVLSGYRAEIAPVAAGRQAWPGAYWYWFAVYVPRSARTPPGWKQTVWQFHGAGSNAPMWFGELMPDGSIQVSRNIIDGGTGTYDPCQYRVEPEYATDCWLNFTMRAEWANAGEGRVEIWLNGNKIVDYRDISIYSTVGDLYWKAGVYMATGLMGFPPPGAAEWSIYTKGLVVGDSAYLSHDAFALAAGVPQRAYGGMRPFMRIPADAYIEPSTDFALTASGTPYNLAGTEGLSILAHVRYAPRAGFQAIIDDNGGSYSFNVEGPTPVSPNPFQPRLRLEVKDASAGQHRAYVNTIYGAPMRQSMWCWLAGTCQFATGEIRLYIDGGEQRVSYLDAQTGFTPAAAANVARLGARTTGTLLWQGALASVRYFRRVLSPAEVAAWYGSDCVSDATQLVSWWKFNQSSGAVIDSGPAAQNAAWQVGVRQYRPQLTRVVASSRAAITPTTVARMVLRRPV